MRANDRCETSVLRHKFYYLGVSSTIFNINTPLSTAKVPFFVESVQCNYSALLCRPLVILILLLLES